MIIALTTTTLLSIAIATTLALKLHRETTSKAYWKTTAQQRTEQITELKTTIENLKTANDSRDRIAILQTLKEQNASAHQELQDLIVSRLTPNQRAEFHRLTTQDQS